jgi:hypothetical protein
LITPLPAWNGPGCGSYSLINDVKSDARYNVEHKNAHFVKGYAADIEQVELCVADSKDSDHEFVHQTPADRCGYDPHDKENVVDN